MFNVKEPIGRDNKQYIKKYSKICDKVYNGLNKLDNKNRYFISKVSHQVG